MANTYGGFIIIGLDEKKTNGVKSGYNKFGWGLDEDKINLQVANATHEVDPIPDVKLKCISDGGKTYVVIRITEEKSKKPFFIKDGKCYVRIGSSSRPASRSVIMNLFEGLEKKKNIASLLASLKVLKVELKDTRDYMHSISPKDQTRPTQVDVEFVVADVIKNQAFLVENGLFGENDDGCMTQGILKAIQTIRKLNVQIAAYNSVPDFLT